jgi:hypothetical protein
MLFGYVLVRWYNKRMFYWDYVSKVTDLRIKMNNVTYLELRRIITKE